MEMDSDILWGNGISRSARLSAKIKQSHTVQDSESRLST